MSDYIKVCATCEHYPNDKHCIGCEWDKNTGDNTKWVSHKVIDRKVIEDIKHDIENQLFVGRLTNHYEFDEGLKWCLEIIDKHTKGDTE